MKNFAGIEVAHRALGKGIITSVLEDRIDIKFEYTERTFVFPDAFVEYLQTEDTELTEMIRHGLEAQNMNRESKKAQDKILSDLKAYIDHEQELAAKPKRKTKKKV